MAGHMLPDTTRYSRLNGEGDAALAWDNSYYLRVRVPLSRSKLVVFPADFWCSSSSFLIWTNFSTRPTIGVRQARCCYAPVSKREAAVFSAT